MASGDDLSPTVSSPRPPPEGGERLAPGTTVGDYVIEAWVGGGAMGEVYRAEQPALGKVVAIKVLRRRLADRPEALERFVREARAVQRIDHPSVLDVFGFGRLPDGRPWLAMRLLAGESLGERLRRGGPLEPEVAIGILRPVAEALAAAHEGGVIHRDLKSDNVFLARGRPSGGDGGAPGERVYVLDFGISKVLGDDAETAASGPGPASLTAEGAWIGTPAYMAPEQWLGSPATPAADVYALGVVAYEMLTGRPPFRGDSLPAVMDMHLRAEPPPMFSEGGGVRVPQALEAVVARALAKAPAERPAGPLELVRACEAALGIDDPGPRARAAARTVRGQRKPRRARRILPLVIGAAVVSAAAAVAVVASSSRRRPRPAAATDLATSTLTLRVHTTPARAQVRLDGRPLGEAPLTLRDRPAGRALVLDLDKPGFRSRHVELTPARDDDLDYSLEPLDGFEGVWRIASGELRRFEHTGERVDGYVPARVGDAGRFLRPFRFVAPAKAAAPDAPDDSAVVTFSATAPHVEPLAPDDPDCQVELATEYRWHELGDRLEQRRQRVRYDVRHGRCVAPGGGALSPEWGPWEAAVRLAAGPRSIMAESRAGAGGPPAGLDANAITPGPSPLIKGKVAPNQDAEAKNDKRPPPAPAKPPLKSPDVAAKDMKALEQNRKPSPKDEALGLDQRANQSQTPSPEPPAADKGTYKAPLSPSPAPSEKGQPQGPASKPSQGRGKR
jgi:serine/threonine-protein kinase